MDINEEKAHVYGLMRDIAAERRMLTDTYYALQERLHALNKLEEIGLPTLKLKGYADLFNETNKRLAASNIAREETEAATPAPSEITAAVRQEIEAQPVASDPEPVAAPAVPIPFEEIDRMKQIDNAHKVRPTRRPREPRKHQISIKRANEEVKNALRDAGTSVTSAELHQLFLARVGLTEEEIPLRSFRSNVLHRAVSAGDGVRAIDVEGTRTKVYEYVGK